MARVPGLEPLWTSGPGEPDYAVLARKREVYIVSGPNLVVRGREAAPGLPILGPKPCRLHVFGPKPRSPDLLVPISTPAPDLAPRPYRSCSLGLVSLALFQQPTPTRQDPNPRPNRRPSLCQLGAATGAQPESSKNIFLSRAPNAHAHARWNRIRFPGWAG